MLLVHTHHHSHVCVVKQSKQASEHTQAPTHAYATHLRQLQLDEQTSECMTEYESRNKVVAAASKDAVKQNMPTMNCYCFSHKNKPTHCQINRTNYTLNQ